MAKGCWLPCGRRSGRWLGWRPASGWTEVARLALALRCVEIELLADSFSAAASTVDGGRVELVARTGTTLLHTWLGSDGSWAEPLAVRSEAWVDPGLPTVHRRG